VVVSDFLYDGVVVVYDRVSCCVFCTDGPCNDNGVYFFAGRKEGLDLITIWGGAY